MVARQDDVIVGHAMFSYVTLRSAQDLEVLALAPVAVAPALQSRGIGGALIQEGIERAEARHEPLVIVEGIPSYYPRFGFEPASRHGIEPPSPEVPDAAFMVRRLSSYHARYRGHVVYPPAFDVT